MKGYPSSFQAVLALAAAMAVTAVAGGALADTALGGLTCERIEGTTVNLIFHSSADVRCTFAGNEGAEQWYMGETGVGLGLDLKWTKVETINFGVLSSTMEFAPEGDFLSGKYAGAKADAAIGVGAGLAVLLGGSGKTIALQPAVETSEGAGVAAGIGYLPVEPDPLNRARIVTPYGSLFSKVLYAGYFDRAFKYRHQPNYEASDYFSARAIAAASG